MYSTDERNLRGHGGVMEFKDCGHGTEAAVKSVHMRQAPAG